MKRIEIRMISLIIAIAVCFSMLPLEGHAMTVPESLVQQRIDELYNKLGGTYFNVGRNEACGKKCYGHGCSNCNTGNILKQQWFKNLFGNVNTSQLVSVGSSCVGFAWFAGWYLFRADNSDTVYRYQVGTFTLNQANASTYARLGDYIWTNGHAAIYLGCNASGIQVLDCNWVGSYNCLVSKHTIGYSNSTFSVVRFYSNRTLCSSHTAGGYMGFDSNHPHYRFYECSICSTRFTDGTTVYVDTCPSCHVHSYYGQVIQPTCTENGYTIKSCNCGSSYRDNLTAPLGHNWGNSEIIQEPTVMTAGIIRFYCTRSGCSETQDASIPPQAISGWCGDNVCYYLSTSGVLTVYPGYNNIPGIMYDYSSELNDQSPWYEYRNFITQIVVKPGIERIGNMAFFNCVNVERVELPDGLVSIGWYAFGGGYQKVERIDFPNTLEIIEDGAFNGFSFISLTIPDSVTSLGKSAFSSCILLRDVTIGSGIKTIPTDAFAACYQLESVAIPQGVEDVMNHSFAFCTSLRRVEIPASVVSFSRFVVNDCPCLEMINVSNENQNYASVDGVLYTKDMTELLRCPGAKTSVVIPDGVKIIKNASFWNDTSFFGPGQEKRAPLLETVVIPASVELIEDSAFVENPYLKSVQFLGNAPEFQSIWSRPGYYVKAETDNETGNFSGSHKDFAIYYYDWNEGWTEDFWQTYKIVPMEHEHQLEEVKGTPPTWTVGGSTDCKVCSLCGEVLENFTEIPALREAPTKPLMVGNTRYDIFEDTVTVTVEVINKTEESVSGALMAAVYVNGKFVGTNSVQEFIAAPGLTSKELTVTANEHGHFTDDVVVKLFFVEKDNMHPLTESWVVE